MEAFQQKNGVRGIFFFFTEVGGKVACLVWGEQIALFKEYKLNWH